jgi:hypothetical protein
VRHAPRIGQAEPAQAVLVADLIAEAFVPIPPTVWLVADADERRHRLAAQFLIIVEHAFDHGHVELTSDWPPPPDRTWIGSPRWTTCSPHTTRTACTTTWRFSRCAGSIRTGASARC